jgi:hypothetical protein
VEITGLHRYLFKRWKETLGGLFGLTDRVMFNESVQSVPLSRCQFAELQTDLAHNDPAETKLAFYLKIGNNFKGYFIQIKTLIAQNDF